MIPIGERFNYFSGFDGLDIFQRTTPSRDADEGEEMKPKVTQGLDGMLGSLFDNSYPENLEPWDIDTHTLPPAVSYISGRDFL